MVRVIMQLLKFSKQNILAHIYNDRHEGEEFFC